MNLKECIENPDKSSTGYKKKEFAQKVEFIRNRFVLFAKRVNKKMEAFMGESVIDGEL